MGAIFLVDKIGENKVSPFDVWMAELNLVCAEIALSLYFQVQSSL
jgi:hypothetical protein